MTLKEFYKIHNKEIDDAVSSALREDKANNDVTTKLLLGSKSAGKKTSAVLLCKEECTLAGLEIFMKVYMEIDRSVTFKSYCKDGDKLKKGRKVLEVRASLGTLLTGERTALNFLQRMSGIATLTASFVSKLKFKDSKILHTRKTTPNFRVFEAAAVKTGGGDFHRLSLSSSVLIKDNHILALGNIADVMDYLGRKKIPDRLKHKFEIEVKTFEELNTVIRLGKSIVKVIMLDNFAPGKLDKAIGSIKKNGLKIEVSGGLNLQNFAKYQRKGIDYYSIGSITHSYTSSDFSLEF